MHENKNPANIFISYSFEDEENVARFHKILAELAAVAGQAAFSEANALDLPKVFATNDTVILENKDGSTSIIGRASEEKRGSYFKRFIPTHA